MFVDEWTSADESSALVLVLTQVQQNEASKATREIIDCQCALGLKSRNNRTKQQSVNFNILSTSPPHPSHSP